ncbi:MAG: SDR family oxidoreductase [Planctomycetes bacterium]|nr:SDR family oxidoreductase [Planctomycetota bacterium]
MERQLSKRGRAIKPQHGTSAAKGRSAAKGGGAPRPVALVTGAARRVGRAIALELARSGFDVVVHWRSSRADAEETAREVEALGAKSWLVRADLSVVAEIEGLFGVVAELVGRLDLLVNNASSFYATPLGSVTEEQWDELLASNLKAPFFCAQFAAPLLQASGRGQIVSLLDSAATRPFPRYLPYSAAKAGLLSLTHGLARALAPKVRVNAVAPGPVLLPEEYDAAQRAGAVDATLLQRAGTPEDVARTVAFLATGPDYLTGAVIPVDGGRSIA